LVWLQELKEDNDMADEDESSEEKIIRIITIVNLSS
jgi:hypothetical protein